MGQEIPAPPQTVKKLLETWLPAHGFALQEYKGWRDYTDGYWVTSETAPYDKATVHYRGPGALPDNLKKVAEALDAIHVEYEWAYLGQWRTLNLIVRMSAALGGAQVEPEAPVFTRSRPLYSTPRAFQTEAEKQEADAKRAAASEKVAEATEGEAHA
jgi:hypothetical protein